RYTLDGSDPDVHSTLYSGPISVWMSSLVRARAFKGGGKTPSDVTTASYDFDAGGLPMPVVTPCSGRHVTTQTLTVSDSDPEATLHYNLSGQEPTESDPVIEAGGTLTVSGNTSLRVRAFKDGQTPSLTRACDVLVTGAVAVGSDYSLGLKSD